MGKVARKLNFKLQIIPAVAGDIKLAKYERDGNKTCDKHACLLNIIFI